MDDLSARCKELSLTTHNIHKRQTSMPPVGFEPATSARERPQTDALARASIGIDNKDKHAELYLSFITRN